MRSHIYRLLIGALLATSGTAIAQPNVVHETHVTVQVRPRTAPPSPREEAHAFRRGEIWIGGRWDWRHNKWEWQAGHYEKVRHGKRWREHRWEEKNGEYVLVDGGWDDADENPTAAPPAVREEKFEARPGQVWVRGRWEWQGGAWDWMPGHYEREQRGKHWREARWESKNGHYVLVEGGWDELPRYPTAAPPTPREEKFEARRGEVWVRGRWDWKDGNWEWLAGHYEKERHGKRWREARWENKEGHYVLVDGGWDESPRYPTAEPPALREEKFEARRGEVWVRGRWDWKDGNWEWLAGHYEKERPGNRWNEGRWERRGDKFEWVEGNWGVVSRYPTAQPPALREERAEEKLGHTWIRGRWDWKDGRWEWVAGHHEKVRPRMRWNEGRWEQKGDHLEWVEGSWGAMMGDPHVTVTPTPPPTPGGVHVVITVPKAAPPAERNEPPQMKGGHIWVKGHYEWKDGAYVWESGHLEKVREKMTWHDPVWENRGGTWTFTAGGWR